MITNLKALIVVFVLAMATFHVAKPFCLQFMSAADYDRRRNLWGMLTVAAFVSPNFWLYLFIAVPLIVRCARKDSSPVTLYLLLMHVIPPLGFFIPIAGINQLFDLNNYRVLALVILIPAAVSMSKQSTPTGGQPELNIPLLCIIGYGLLKLVLSMPYESITNTMRRGFLYSLDVFIIYYVFSRACVDRRRIKEMMAVYCLSCAILAIIALFESFRGWLLYEGISVQWGSPMPFMYLTRGDTLRAQASSGHSLALGYMMAISFGFCICLMSSIKSRKLRYLPVLWMAFGLFAAYSRAPWITALLLFLTYTALSPKGFSRLMLAIVVGALISGVLLVSPLGDRIIGFLPFVGNVDTENVAYRQQLAELSWQLIQKNVLFGDPFVMNYMESLRQGQGIIDLVNTYAEVTLFTGVVGLALFVGPFFVGIAKAYVSSRKVALYDSQFSLIGINIIAAMIATLFMMATGSFGTGLAQMYYVLAGISANYAAICLLGESNSHNSNKFKAFA